MNIHHPLLSVLGRPGSLSPQEPRVPCVMSVRVKVKSRSVRTPSDDEVSDKFFDGWSVARTPAARSLIEAVQALLRELDRVGSPDGRFEPRKRSRRPADRLIHEQQVEALVCQLVITHLTHPDRGLCVSRSKAKRLERNRYSAPWITEKLTSVMDALEVVGVVWVNRGVQRWKFDAPKGRMTTLGAGPVLVKMIKQSGVSVSDFGRHPEEEVIVLKGPKPYANGAAERSDYEDTAETVRMRSEMRQINAWLEAADIEYHPVDDAPRHARVNDHQRRLQRIFTNGRFDHHGRLYGGFWQTLSKDDRLSNIVIDGDPVVGLDYGQMGVRLMYAEAGVVPPQGDVYRIPGLEVHREGVKRFMAAMLNTSKPLKRFPGGLRDLFPPLIEVGGVKKVRSSELITGLILNAHAPIAHLFHQGQGLQGMAMESDIMVKVLLELIDRGITALPIHDGLLVGEGHAGVAREVMLWAFREVTGQDGVVDLDE